MSRKIFAKLFFVVQYDDTIGANALARAQAILATCERDFERLSKYLPYQRGLVRDPFIRHQIFVQLEDLVIRRGGARNTGYQPGSRQIIIWINAIDRSGSEITDDYARFLFIAEVAEVLMGGYGWDLALSCGEALSRILAEVFYPAEAFVANAPWVNAWLNSNPRPGWITKSEATDMNEVSYGCGVLFINFLCSQLYYTLPHICTGGVTLADTYHNLTGRADDGFTIFIQLLEKHFPTGELHDLLTNNPFLLYDAAQRSVFLSVEKTLVAEWFSSEGVTQIAPYFNCPVKDYKYTIVYEEMRPRLPVLQGEFNILKTLPDPPPPGVMQKILQSVERIREHLTEVAQTNRQLAIEAVSRLQTLVLSSFWGNFCIFDELLLTSLFQFR